MAKHQGGSELGKNGESKSKGRESTSKKGIAENSQNEAKATKKSENNQNVKLAKSATKSELSDANQKKLNIKETKKGNTHEENQGKKVSQHESVSDHAKDSKNESLTSPKKEKKEQLNQEKKERASEVSFPEFPSKFTAILPADLYKETDYNQFKACNAELKRAIANNPELKRQFSSFQLEQICSGKTPDGYVWHHHQDCGKMQLVDSYVHQSTHHTGGKSIWGGGKDCR